MRQTHKNKQKNFPAVFPNSAPIYLNEFGISECSRHSTSVFTARVPMNSTTCFHERQRMRELQVTAVWWTRTANPNIVAKPFIVISRSWHSYNIRLRTAIVVFIGLSSLTNLV